MNKKIIDGEYDKFIMFASAKYVNVPEIPTQGIDIEVTGNINDVSQKNFEVLVQSIALRCTPMFDTNPVPSNKLEFVGAPTLVGNGYVWEFWFDQGDVFTKIESDGTENPVGLLVSDLHNIVLPSGVVINTLSDEKNVEFVKIMRKI